MIEKFGSTDVVLKDGTSSDIQFVYWLTVYQKVCCRHLTFCLSIDILSIAMFSLVCQLTYYQLKCSLNPQSPLLKWLGWYWDFSVIVSLIHSSLETHKFTTHLLVFYLHIVLGISVRTFTKGVTTTTNRNFFKLLINLLSIGVATNNVQYPSVGITKKFNNMQRVSVGGKLIDLEKAVKHNVRTIVKFYQKKWPANKLERLLPNDPLVNVSMMMEKTFQIIGKYHTTYKKNGMSCGWVDRDSHCDMKHPHQVFLLQNLCMKLTFDTETKMRAMTFHGMNPNDPEPWKRFFSHYSRLWKASERELCWLGWWESY